MSKKQVLGVVKRMLREQILCLGRVFVRHDVPDDVVWEVVKGFDLIYQKIKQEAGKAALPVSSDSPVRRLEPHPAITHFLERIEE